MTERTEWDIALSKAKIQLMGSPNSVFFSSLCFSLQHSFREDIPTACTDGKHVYYNPQFFMSLSKEERVFLLLHETMHCAYMHMFRCKQLNLDARKFNIAADHVINLQLIERGFNMPKGGLADRQYLGMFAEKVYALLPDDAAPAPMDDLMDPGDSEDTEGIQRDIEDALVRASLQSKMSNDKPGTIPGDIEIFLNKLLNPVLPWQTILRKYMQAFNKTNYSWRKPNRRYFPEHYLPTMYGESLMNIAIAVDASGSVSDTDFLQFVSETHTIIKAFQPKEITLIQFDTDIRSVDIVKSTQELSKVVFTGRGGTCIEPVLEWANTHKPQLLLVFTDGEFNFSNTTCKSNIVWLIHNNPVWKAPFGKVIHYTLE